MDEEVIVEVCLICFVSGNNGIVKFIFEKFKVFILFEKFKVFC